MGGPVALWKRPGVRPSQPTTILELLERVVVCPSGCWLFIGGDSGTDGRGRGYGRILRPGTRNAMAAHRYVYLTFKGPIPKGWHVDHLCRAWAFDEQDALLCRRCLNPEHLEAVPHLVNYARRDRDNGRLVAAADLVLPRGSIEDDLVAAFEDVA